MMLLFGLALAEPVAWTARTPIGELSVERTEVRLVVEVVEFTVLSHDELQVRTDYVLDNPGDKKIVRFSVPVTSGGRDGGRPSSAAASIRLTDATDEFVPCLITTVPAKPLPLTSEAGAHQVTGACTADVVIPSGVSRLRLSYEGELFYESRSGTGIPVSDRSLVYDFRGGATWAGTPDKLEVTVDFGPFASATPPLPKKAIREGRIAAWTLDRPKHDALGVLVLPLGGAEADAGHVVARAPQPDGLQLTANLHDGDPTTTWCGPATRLRLPAPLACGPTVWSTPAVPVAVVDCETEADLVVSKAAQPGGHVAVLGTGGDCFELRPADGGCLGEVALRPASCPVPEDPQDPVRPAP